MTNWESCKVTINIVNIVQGKKTNTNHNQNPSFMSEIVHF